MTGAGGVRSEKDDRYVARFLSPEDARVRFLPGARRIDSSANRFVGLSSTIRILTLSSACIINPRLPRRDRAILEAAKVTDSCRGALRYNRTHPLRCSGPGRLSLPWPSRQLWEAVGTLPSDGSH